MFALHPDIGFVYPKTGLDADLRFDTTPTYVSTGSMFLDGTNDRLDCDGATWASTGAWTIACWIKCAGSSTTSQLILSATDGSNTLDLYASGGAAANVHLHDGNSGQNIASNALLFDGTWHHFALTCGAGSGATATLYFDGQVQGTITCTCDDLSSATTLHIGANSAGASTLAGNLAHFGIWESALSQSSVRKLMTATTYAQVTAQSGATPVDYWLLEVDGSASVGQAGTLTNGAIIVGDRARLPSGLDLTSNQHNAQCFSGRAVAFDGTGGSANDQLLADSYTDSSDYFSLSIWFKASAAGLSKGLWTNGPHTEDVEHGLIWFNSGLVRYHYTDGTAQYCMVSDYNPEPGIWHHIVATVDGSTSSAYDVKLYLNGKLQSASKTTSGATWYASDGLTVGSQYGHAGYWDGSIADCRMFNVELTAAQALELYQNPEQVLPTSVSASALKRFYSLCDYDITGAESLDGLYLQDSSGNGKHLLATGTAMEFAQPACPQLGLRSSTSRCLFNDSNTVMRLSPSGTDIDCGPVNGSGAFTYLFWFNTFTANTDARLLDANAGAGPVVFIDSGSTSSYVRVRTKIDFGGSYHTWDTPNDVILVGEWVHLGITFAGGDSNEVVYYVNGSSVAVTNPTGTPSGTQGADSNIKDIGGTGSTVVWDGFISEFAVFAGTQLDAAAVAAVYNSGIQGFDLLADSGDYDVSSSLSGWWKIDNPSSVADLKGSSTNGAWNNVPSMATIPEGATKGSSAWGSLTTTRLSSGVLALPPVGSTTGALGGMAEMAQPAFGTQNFTIACWVHCDAFLSGYPYLYNFAAGSNEYGVKAFVVNSGGAIQWTYEGATTSQTGSGTAGGVGKWTFTVFQRLGAASFKLKARLIDSASWAFTTSKTVDVGDMTEAGPGYWGNYGASNSLCGPLAFPRVYLHGSDAAWSEDELNAIFEQGKRFLIGDS
jgi:hypothetical protein